MEKLMYHARPLPVLIVAAAVLISSSLTEAGEPDRPGDVTLTVLRLEEQLASFRCEQELRIRHLDQKLLSRLRPVEIDPFVRPADTLCVSMQTFVGRGDVEAGLFSVLILEQPSFTRVVLTQIESKPYPRRRFAMRYGTRQITRRQSAPVLSFMEAVEAGDIKKAMVFQRLEIDFEFLRESPVLCGASLNPGQTGSIRQEVLIADDEAAEPEYSIFPYSLGFSR
jgi:hypothetical protein